MAVKAKETHEYQQVSGNTTQDQQTQKKKSTGGQFGNIMFGHAPYAVLSSAGTEFQDVLKKHMADRASIDGVTIKMLSNPGGTMAVIKEAEQVAIILLFAESIPTPSPMTPAASYSKFAVDELITMYPSMKILDIVVVDDTMYTNANKMAAWLACALYAATSREVADINLDMMRTDQYNVSTNIGDVTSFMQQYSPHTIQARADVGFALQIRDKNVPKNIQYDPNMRNIPQYKTVMAVSAYTEILFDGSMFLPIIHITEILATQPTIRIIPIAMALAADVFLLKQLWTTQFTNIGKAGASTNVGNHWKTDKGLWSVDSAEKARAVITGQYFYPPIMVLDITQGRASIPGLEHYTVIDSARHISKQWKEILDVDIPTDKTVCTVKDFDTIGHVVHGANKVDTRCIDYLTLVQKLKNNPGLEVLRSTDIVGRKKFLAEIFPDINYLFLNQICMIDPESVNKAAHKVSTLSIDSNQASTSMDMSQYTAAAASWMNNLTPVTNQYSGQHGNMGMHNPYTANMYYQ